MKILAHEIGTLETWSNEWRMEKICTYIIINNILKSITLK